MEPKENQNLWIQILRAVETKVDPNSFETWFDPTSFIGQEQDCLYIKVPNSYFRDWLSFHYSTIINNAPRTSSVKPLTSATSTTIRRPRS